MHIAEIKKGNLIIIESNNNPIIICLIRKIEESEIMMRKSIEASSNCLTKEVFLGMDSGMK